MPNGLAVYNSHGAKIIAEAPTTCQCNPVDKQQLAVASPAELLEMNQGDTRIEQNIIDTNEQHHTIDHRHQRKPNLITN